MIVYLDTSAILRVLLHQGDPLEEWGNWEEAYSSEIVRLESRRVIDRLRLESHLDDLQVAETHDELSRLEDTLGFIPLTRQVLRRASLPMATVVRSLDAIHLASALLFEERMSVRIRFATHDVQQATAARALGFAVLGT